MALAQTSAQSSEFRAPDQQLPPVFLTSPLGEQRHPTSAFPMTFTLLRAKLFVGHTWSGKHLRVTFDSFLLHHRALSYSGGPSSTHVPPLPLLCQGQRQAAVTSHHDQAGVSWWPLPSVSSPHLIPPLRLQTERDRPTLLESAFLLVAPRKEADILNPVKHEDVCPAHLSGLASLSSPVLEQATVSSVNSCLPFGEGPGKPLLAF